MIILFLFALRGVIPIDLPEIKSIKWHGLTKQEIYKTVLQIKEPDIYTASTIALCRMEQPGRSQYYIFFPDNNSAGFHSWAKRKYWGWSKYYFENAKVLPIGYFLWREGATKQKAVFFAFANFEEFFLLIYEIVKQRNITNSYAYYRRWVGNYKIVSSIFDYEKQKIFYELMNLYIKKKLNPYFKN